MSRNPEDDFFDFFEKADGDFDTTGFSDEQKMYFMTKAAVNDSSTQRFVVLHAP